MNSNKDRQDPLRGQDCSGCGKTLVEPYINYGWTVVFRDIIVPFGGPCPTKTSAIDNFLSIWNNDGGLDRKNWKRAKRMGWRLVYVKSITEPFNETLAGPEGFGGVSGCEEEAK